MNEIKHSWHFDQSPETIWEYLTDAELLGQWLMPNDIKPIVGHKFTFKTTPYPHSGFDGIIHCEVLEANPYKKFSYSWKGGPGDGTFILNTMATWTLEPTGNGTTLHLLHTGFTEANQMTYTIMNEGWGKHVKDRLDKLINTAKNETAEN